MSESVHAVECKSNVNITNEVFNNHDILFEILSFLTYKDICLFIINKATFQKYAKDVKPVADFVLAQGVFSCKTLAKYSPNVFMELSEATRILLAENYPPNLLTYLDPIKFVKVPRFDVPSMLDNGPADNNSNYLKKSWWIEKDAQSTGYLDFLDIDIFPPNFNVVRGSDSAGRKFFCFKDSLDKMNTIFQRYIDDTNLYTTAKGLNGTRLFDRCSSFSMNRINPFAQLMLSYVHASLPGQPLSIRQRLEDDEPLRMLAIQNEENQRYIDEQQRLHVDEERTCCVIS